LLIPFQNITQKTSFTKTSNNKYVLRIHLAPLFVPVHEQRHGFVGHTPKGGKGFHALEAGGRLQGHDAEQSENGVLPVFVEHPQQGAKDLKDGQGRHQLLLEQVGHLRLRNAHLHEGDNENGTKSKKLKP